MGMKRTWRSQDSTVAGTGGAPVSRRGLLAVFAIAMGVFCTGINWGLPSRKVDPFLFGDRPVWTGAQILALLPNTVDDTRGADVDANPISPSTQPVVLNATDAQRAEIVRRYRLFTCQPDEMITMMALSQMRPGEGKLDPKLYQYGGLWIYPVGALIKLCSMVGLVELRNDQTYYLDHPEEFGKFYIVARAYVVLWGLVGVLAVQWIARRVSGNQVAALVAGLCYVLLPVVVNMSHEAKPHLPGAVLVLLAVVAGTKYVDSGRAKWWVATAVLCGAAAGMVLSCAMAVVVLPVMLLLRPDTWTRRAGVLSAACAIAVTVYFATNPYVLIHLLGDRGPLLSNLRNSTAMYQAPATLLGMGTGLVRLAQAASIPVLAFGLIGIVVRTWKRNPTLLLLIAPALVVLVQFLAMATGKPGEYGRFALLPAIALTVVGASALPVLTRSRWERVALTILLVGGACVWSAGYVWHFVLDSSERTSRMIGAERLALLADQGFNRIQCDAEPAPWSLPPADLYSWTIVLDRTNRAPQARTVRIGPVDNDGLGFLGPDGTFQLWTRHRLLATPISWAHKPFRVILGRPAPSTSPEH